MGIPLSVRSYAGVVLEKQQLRREIQARRGARGRADQAADPGARTGRSGVTENLIAVATGIGATRVACFVGVRGEPDTAGFLAWAHTTGVDVLLPRSLADGSLEWALHVPGNLGTGAFGIPEPQGPAVVGGSATVDLIFVPAAAVDVTGGRLGWGRGFYDRELARIAALGAASPAVFAVVWESEILAAVPREPHDVPVHGAVTEETVHHFG